MRAPLSISLTLKVFVFGFLILFVKDIAAQLDDVHYIPPLHNRNTDGTSGNRYQAIYLSTPSPTPITIDITTGTGTFLKSFTIDNSAPAIFDLNDFYGNNNNVYEAGSDVNNLAADNTFLSVRSSLLNQALNDYGLILRGADEFYANYRLKSNAQAASLTAKGEGGVGLEYFVGALPTNANSSSRTFTNITVGFMALEDNTTINLSGLSPNTELHDDGPNITGTNHTITLNQGQTYVLSTYTDENRTPNTADDLIGAHVVADKPIVMSNGNLLHGPNFITGQSRDMAIDQSVPVNQLGTTYVYYRGNHDNDDAETPVIIAINDNTDVSVNGVFLDRIDEGEFLQINGSHYTADRVMLVETSTPAYAYQQLFGGTRDLSSGMNFLPPLSCYLPTETDYMPRVDELHPAVPNDLDVDISVVTFRGSGIRVFDVGSNTPKLTLTPADAIPVPGTTDWIAYIIEDEDDNIRVESDGPLATGLFGFSDRNGVAGYYTGFGQVPFGLQIGTASFRPLTSSAIIEAINVPPEADFQAWIRFSDGLVFANDDIIDVDQPGDYAIIAPNGTCTDTLIFRVSCDDFGGDHDGDGVGDQCDLDDDNDGILDTDEWIEREYAIDFNTDSEGWIKSNNNSGVNDGIIAHSTDATTSTGCDMSLFPLTPFRSDFILDIDVDPGVTYFRNSIPLGINDPQLLGGTISIRWINGTLDDESGDQNGNTELEVILTNSTGLSVQTNFDVTDFFNRGWRRYAVALEEANFTGASGDLLAVLSDLQTISIGVETLDGQEFSGDCNEAEYFGLDEIVLFQVGPDTDGDGFEDHLDLDSDGDGCFDTEEAEVDDVNRDGIAGAGNPMVDDNGLVIGITYQTPADFSWKNPAVALCFNEVCGDGLDNDRDGLIDDLDPDCGCTEEYCGPCDSDIPSERLFISKYGSGQCEDDIIALEYESPDTLVTTEENLAQEVPGSGWSDLAFTPNGNMYGNRSDDGDNMSLYLINPFTGRESRYICDIDGANPFLTQQELVGDLDGFLYTVLGDGTNTILYRYKPSDDDVPGICDDLTIVVDLTSTGLIGTGDLAWSEGLLYWTASISNTTASPSQIVEINIFTGEFRVLPLLDDLGSPLDNIESIMNDSDGNLIVGDSNSNLFTLDRVDFSLTPLYSLINTCGTIGGSASKFEFLQSLPCIEDCSDGVDNDADGLTDLDDPECPCLEAVTNPHIMYMRNRYSGQ